MPPVPVEFSNHSLAGVEVDAIAVFAVADGDDVVLGADAEALAGHLGIDIADAMARLHADGSAGSVARIPTAGATKARSVLVVGLGSEPGLDALRAAAGSAARAADKDSSLALVVPGDLLAGPAAEDVDAGRRAQAVAEGAALGAYAYTEHRRKPTDLPSLQRVVVLGGRDLRETDVRNGSERGAVIARGANLARDLVNTPPAFKRPPALAQRMSEAAAEHGVKTRIWSESELAEGGFGGILGVGRGSSEPPALVELTYAPRAAKRHVVLVGKGITFDSGGLSLKPSSSMETMKSDMAGAAAVVGVMTLLRELGVKARVTGLCALAENMPGGDATRVSDVLTQRGGTTVEVMNTDAEGRLVLADALAYGAESEPDAMVDVATLTGAQVVALGDRISALMGTDEELLRTLEEAAAASGERVWRLPLPDDYVDMLRSEVADHRNVASQRSAGAIVAALFLRIFVDDVPWAHLDIAGPAFSESGDGGVNGPGATGVGVRLLAEWLRAEQ